MNYDQFIESLKLNDPPETSPFLRALWFEKKNDWDQAHSIAQDIHDREGSWIHAYLHRVEGDEWNASYWYSKAGKKMPDFSTDEEWEKLVQHFLPGQG